MMKLGGMTCPSCLTKIEKAVENVDGTDQIKVLFNAGKLKFVMDANKTNTDDKTISLRELFEAALRDQGYNDDEINKRLSEDFNENGTFKDYSSHTIKFYYLERGNGGSNCQIRFNLPTIPEGTLGFTKDVTYTNVNDTSDINFLFNAYIDPDGDEGTENYALYDGPYVVVDADTNRFIELKETERIDINGDGRYSAEEQNVIVLKDMIYPVRSELFMRFV